MRNFSKFNRTNASSATQVGVRTDKRVPFHISPTNTCTCKHRFHEHFCNCLWPKVDLANDGNDRHADLNTTLSAELDRCLGFLRLKKRCDKRFLGDPGRPNVNLSGHPFLTLQTCSALTPSCSNAMYQTTHDREGNLGTSLNVKLNSSSLSPTTASSSSSPSSSRSPHCALQM